MKTFDDIYILNLHGNSKKQEKAPDGGKDENVFDIQQGVAIGIFVKRPPAVIPAKAGIQTSQTDAEAQANLDSRLRGNDSAEIHYAELYGRRKEKEEWLFANSLKTTEWKTLSPSSPHYLFIPQDETLRAEYEKGLKINEIFPVNSVGVVTARDGLTIAFTKEELIERVSDFLKLSPEEAREKYDLGEDVRDWKVEWAQKDLKGRTNWVNDIVPILYRPFDVRWTIYTGNSRGFLCYPRAEVMKHMVGGKNMGLVVVRREERVMDYNQMFVSDTIAEHSVASIKTISYIVPLYVDGKPNLTYSKMSIINEKPPIALFNYLYALLNSNSFRSRYLNYLRIDFPRIPFTSDSALFNHLANLGGKLIERHLLRFTLEDTFGLPYPVKGNDVVGKGFPKYQVSSQMDSHLRGNEENLGRVYINKDQYFEGVAPDVWNFHVGGYQALDKWVRERQGRKLTDDDRLHFRKIVRALSDTILIMKEIDDTIPGWPLM